MVGSLEISGAFTRAMPPRATTGGGFLTITNKGAEADQLVFVTSPTAGMSQIHEMKMDGEVMVMRELEKGVEIPAGETIVLAPGGTHLMFMKVATPFVEGEEVMVTLTFEKAGSVDLALPVEPIGATGMTH